MEQVSLTVRVREFMGDFTDYNKFKYNSINQAEKDMYKIAQDYFKKYKVQQDLQFIFEDKDCNLLFKETLKRDDIM